MSFKWVRGELIGTGACSRVYLALNATTGEMFAAKQLTVVGEIDSRQIQAAYAVKAENETLDHPNLVQFIGFEETDLSEHVSFMEYVPGGSIAGIILKHGKIGEESTKSFASQILTGLGCLHSKGIDLRADNILVEMTGVCKISHFGISKRLNGANSDQGGARASWLVPEILRNEGQDPKSDIWSVGCVVLEMWAGSRATSNVEIATMFEPPVPDGVVLTPLADGFRNKCFAINPEERPTAAELRSHPYLAQTVMDPQGHRDTPIGT
ncbi:kinase-like protein [Mycena maculata]|uniref:Kinase-like protein n=1 Tax=Mycena maculata TaxID=230809 RepID=A0AAD7JUH1_9AGAR|nr:kinase-like protein [Mycena maculata]